MKQVKSKLVNKFLFSPRKLHFVIFGILVTPIILFGLLSLSFSWLIPFEQLLVPVYVVALLILRFTYYLDNRFKMKSKYYTFIGIALLIIYTALSYPVKNFLVSKSEKQGEQISKLIEEYKAMNGSYPDSLNIEYFKNVPMHRWLGSTFRYIKRADNGAHEEFFEVSYLSFDGYVRNYNSLSKEWRYSD